MIIEEYVNNLVSIYELCNKTDVNLNEQIIHFINIWHIILITFCIWLTE